MACISHELFYSNIFIKRIEEVFISRLSFFFEVVFDRIWVFLDEYGWFMLLLVPSSFELVMGGFGWFVVAVAICVVRSLRKHTALLHYILLLALELAVKIYHIFSSRD